MEKPKKPQVQWGKGDKHLKGIVAPDQGKGGRNRISNRQKYRQNYDQINWGSKKCTSQENKKK